MRKVLISFGSIAISVYLFTCLATQVCGQQVLKVSGHPQYPPIMWKEKDTLIGAAPEIVKQILTDLKVPFEIVQEGTWEEVLEKAKGGEVDVIVAAYMDNQRLKYLDYSVSYIADPVAIMVRKGHAFKFNIKEDLIGKVGVTGPGESYGMIMDGFIRKKLNVKRMPLKEAFQNLVDGKVDYMIIGRYPGVIEAVRLGLNDEVEVLPHNLTQQNFHLTISKGSYAKKYLPQINAKLEDYKKTGKIKKLIAKYLEQCRKKLLKDRKKQGEKKAKGAEKAE